MQFREHLTGAPEVALASRLSVPVHVDAAATALFCRSVVSAVLAAFTTLDVDTQQRVSAVVMTATCGVVFLSCIAASCRQAVRRRQESTINVAYSPVEPSSKNSVFSDFYPNAIWCLWATVSAPCLAEVIEGVVNGGPSGPIRLSPYAGFLSLLPLVIRGLVRGPCCPRIRAGLDTGLIFQGVVLVYLLGEPLKHVRGVDVGTVTLVQMAVLILSAVLLVLLGSTDTQAIPFASRQCGVSWFHGGWLARLLSGLVISLSQVDQPVWLAPAMMVVALGFPWLTSTASQRSAAVRSDSDTVTCLTPSGLYTAGAAAFLARLLVDVAQIAKPDALSHAAHLAAVASATVLMPVLSVIIRCCRERAVPISYDMDELDDPESAMGPRYLPLPASISMVIWALFSVHAMALVSGDAKQPVWPATLEMRLAAAEVTLMPVVLGVGLLFEVAHATFQCCQKRGQCASQQQGRQRDGFFNHPMPINTDLSSSENPCFE